VPDDYFFGLPEKWLRKSGQADLLMHVPEGYFDGLAGSVMDRIRSGGYGFAETNSRTDKALGESTGLQPFQVPDGYFETLPGLIRAKAVSEPAVTKTPIIPIGYRRTVRLLAAAAVMLIITTGVFRFMTGRSSTEVAIQPLDPSIERGRQMNEQQFSEQLNRLSEDDILSYLEKHGTPQDVVQLGAGLETGDMPGPEDYLLDETALDNLLPSTSPGE
jgi:hypothetical protein